LAESLRALTKKLSFVLLHPPLTSLLRQPILSLPHWCRVGLGVDSETHSSSHKTPVETEVYKQDFGSAVKRSVSAQ
jgi:hypothetical protein